MERLLMTGLHGRVAWHKEGQHRSKTAQRDHSTEPQVSGNKAVDCIRLEAHFSCRLAPLKSRSTKYLHFT